MKQVIRPGEGETCVIICVGFQCWINLLDLKRKKTDSEVAAVSAGQVGRLTLAFLLHINDRVTNYSLICLLSCF